MKNVLPGPPFQSVEVFSGLQYHCPAQAALLVGEEDLKKREGQMPADSWSAAQGCLETPAAGGRELRARKLGLLLVLSCFSCLWLFRGHESAALKNAEAQSSKLLDKAPNTNHKN